MTKKVVPFYFQRSGEPGLGWHLFVAFNSQVNIPVQVRDRMHGNISHGFPVNAKRMMDEPGLSFRQSIFHSTGEYCSLSSEEICFAAWSIISRNTTKSHDLMRKRKKKSPFRSEQKD
jgi:hypothetical protein